MKSLFDILFERVTGDNGCTIYVGDVCSCTTNESYLYKVVEIKTEYIVSVLPVYARSYNKWVPTTHTFIHDTSASYFTPCEPDEVIV